MDRTKEYILQCEKAEKYLPKWTHKDIDEWDYLHCKYTEYEDGLVHPYNILCGLDMESWTRVYRQDQLQDMIIMSDNAKVTAVELIRIIDFEVYGRYGREHYGISPTFEKIWLCYVMKVNYNKIWDGQDWETLKV